MRSAKGAKSLQGSMPRDPKSVKVRPDRFLFAGVISEEVISYDRIKIEVLKDPERRCSKWIPNEHDFDFDPRS